MINDNLVMNNIPDPNKMLYPSLHIFFWEIYERPTAIRRQPKHSDLPA